MLDAFNWVLANWSVVLNAIVALLTGVIAVAMLFPSDQPEKFLQSVVDFIKKFSAK